MRILSLIFIFLSMSLTSSVVAATVPEAFSSVPELVEGVDSTVGAVHGFVEGALQDTIASGHTDTICNDTVRKKRLPWYVRFYRFADRVLSPPRDSNYIDVQDYYNWQAELQLTERFELYEMDASDMFSMRVSPSPRWRIGPFFGWRFAFLGYNFDIQSLFFNNDDTDLSWSVYSAAFGLDMFYRRVGGMYNIRKLQVGDNDFTDQLNGHGFDGIHQGMTRISFYYITNYKHYSHQASFNQTNRQIRSAGSPLFGIQYAHNTVSVDVGKLVRLIGISSVNDTPLSNILQDQANDEISISVGYGYNWVFAKNWLAAGELTGGIGYLIQHTNMETQEKDNESKTFLRKLENFYRKNLALNANFRFAVLWNNGPWFAGAQAVGFFYQYGNGTVMTRDLMGCAYFFVGYNFRSFLPKRHKKKH